ncbi:MAG: hypothetical protein D6735_06680 [Acidobacteria bacterium]|nr:MAG: hypothetical protein D6735_06680 [Acidobacteriota bacterium]
MDLTAIAFIRDFELATTLHQASVQYNSEQSAYNIKILSQAIDFPTMVQQVQAMSPRILIIDHNAAPTPEARASLARFISERYHDSREPMVTIALLPSMEDKTNYEQIGVYKCLLRPNSVVDAYNQVIIQIPTIYTAALEDKQRDNYVPILSDSVKRTITQQGWQRQIISVWSPKGGVGKTTISCELAVALAEICKLEVLLIDADMNVSDCHVVLGMKYSPKNLFTLSQAFDGNKSLNEKIFGDYLSVWGPSKRLRLLMGLSNMFMGSSPTLLGEKGERFFTEVINVAKRMGFDFIIIDTGQKFVEPVHYVSLRSADTVLVIATSELTTASEILMIMNTMRDKYSNLNIPVERSFKLVVNRWDERGGIALQELVNKINIPLLTTINECYDGSVLQSANLHKPVVLRKANENSADAQSGAFFAKNIISLASRFYPPIADIHNASDYSKSDVNKARSGLFNIKKIIAR